MKTQFQAVMIASVLTVAQAYAADPAPLDHGNLQFQKWCAPCHAPASREAGMGGMPLPGTFSIMLKYQDKKPGALEEWTDLNPELVRLVVRKGAQSMPFFRKTEISDADLDAIAAYLTRNNKS